MKRLRKIYAKSKKLDEDLVDFLNECISIFTYNTNTVLLNQCMSYINSLNLKNISEDEESELYMYYMKIKSFAIRNNLEDEFSDLNNQAQVDSELVNDGYDTDVIINDGTKVSGDQIVATYKTTLQGDTYYIFEVNDKFILKSSSDLNTDLLVADNDDDGFEEIENEILNYIKNIPNYFRNTTGLVGINTATQGWQDYISSMPNQNGQNNNSSNDNSNDTDDEEEEAYHRRKKIKDKTEYQADIKFDSKDIAPINSFVSKASNDSYVVDIKFEQIKNAALNYRLIKRAFIADNMITGFKSFFPNMSFISAYFKDEDKSDCCGLIATVDDYFIGLSYGCDNDFTQFKSFLNNLYSTELTDVVDADERTILISYYNENNLTANLMNEYNEYKQDNQAWIAKMESSGDSLDDISRMIETMEDLAKPENQDLNYYSEAYQSAIINVFIRNSFYVEQFDSFDEAEEFIFANNNVHSYTFYNNAYSPSEGKTELEQSPKYYLHVIFYRYYRDSLLSWLNAHEKIILNFTDVIAQVSAVPEKKKGND